MRISRCSEHRVVSVSARKLGFTVCPSLFYKLTNFISAILDLNTLPPHMFFIGRENAKSKRRSALRCDEM